MLCYGSEVKSQISGVKGSSKVSKVKGEGIGLQI